MATEILNTVETFFSYRDASFWVDSQVSAWEGIGWDIKKVEIQLMDSGAYRAGVIFERSSS